MTGTTRKYPLPLRSRLVVTIACCVWPVVVVMGAGFRRTLDFVMMDMALGVCLSGGLLIVLAFFLSRQTTPAADPLTADTKFPSARGIALAGTVMIGLGLFGLLTQLFLPTGGFMTLPIAPSEDMSHLLTRPASTIGTIDFHVVRNFLPDPNVDWVVTCDFETTVSGNDLRQLFHEDWIYTHGLPLVYGYSSDEKCWTFVNAIDSPDRFNSLKIAWPLWDGIGKQPKNLSVDDLDRYQQSAVTMLTPLGLSAATLDRSAEEALARVAAFPSLVAECCQDVTLRLVASEGSMLDGRELWDVMLCLGLEYGDGDLFHWINNSGHGEDYFFSIETSTPPGYFSPRRIASGAGDVEDLFFLFSIPRSSDPVAVFDSMVNAVEYTQQRLGGRIVLGTGEPFEKETERKKIETIVQKLRQAGFPPGESTTCRVF